MNITLHEIHVEKEEAKQHIGQIEQAYRRSFQVNSRQCARRGAFTDRREDWKNSTSYGEL
jgi:hypothetical protein